MTVRFSNWLFSTSIDTLIPARYIYSYNRSVYASRGGARAGERKGNGARMEHIKRRDHLKV